MYRFLTLTLILLWAAPLDAREIHRNAFEATEVTWQRGPSDADYRVTAHDLDKQIYHTGQQAEHLQLSVNKGTYIYYTYPLGRAGISDGFSARIWVKGNRPGLQLMARVVLPNERDPNNLDSPLITYLHGEKYRLQGRWQSVVLEDVDQIAAQQRQLLQAELKREVNFTDAYIDMLILDMYTGPGQVECWLDDLEVGPIETAPARREQPFAPASNSNEMTLLPETQLPRIRPGARQAVIELNQDRLEVNKQPFFIRGIRHGGTPLKALRDAGFNTLWLDYRTSPDVLDEAAKLGFWLAPRLPVLEEDPAVSTPAALAKTLAEFPRSDAVLAWELGTGLTEEQSPAINRAAETVDSADNYSGRPVAGDIWDGFQGYSRGLDMVGVHRWPLMTGLELSQYQEWLEQRQNLARPGTYLYTWIQTHLPDWYTQLVFGHTGDEAFSEVIGPQPEQIRLLTYLAVATGYKGLGFWSDQFLADSHHGRDRLLTLALLNQELKMLEPMLATARRPTWIETNHPEVRAAVLPFKGGVLALPIWMGKGAQFVPGQLATNNLEMVVPHVSMSAQAWEVSPGVVRSLKRQRVPGGVKVVLPEFGISSAIVFTSEIAEIAQLQQAVNGTQRMASQFAIDLATEEYLKVEQVNAQLDALGVGLPAARQWMSESRQSIDIAGDKWGKGRAVDYREAYLEARRALRPLRLLMRAHWEQAVQHLPTPVASPYAVSFFTLPRHWQLVNQLRNTQIGPNVLSTGGFESTGNNVRQISAGTIDSSSDWQPQKTTLDRVDLSAQSVGEQPREGQSCLKLTVRPNDPDRPPVALERTFLALNSPRVQTPPGGWVRISGWVRIPHRLESTVDGALLFDSVGGEPLAVRLMETNGWQQFTIYRQSPPTGSIGVTVALTGIGTVYFDDIRIEPLLVGAGPSPNQ